MPRSSKMGCDAYVEAYDDVQYFLGYGTKGSKYGASSYIYESEGKSIKTLYLGDSHMEQCAPRILELCATSKTGERGYVFFIRGGLVPIPNVSGNTISFSQFKGKKVLIVNTASTSKYKRQFESLQQLYAKYKDSLTVIIFPSNSFSNEPLSNLAIADSMKVMRRIVVKIGQFF